MHGINFTTKHCGHVGSRQSNQIKLFRVAVFFLKRVQRVLEVNHRWFRDDSPVVAVISTYRSESSELRELRCDKSFVLRKNAEQLDELLCSKRLTNFWFPTKFEVRVLNRPGGNGVEFRNELIAIDVCLVCFARHLHGLVRRFNPTRGPWEGIRGTRIEAFVSSWLPNGLIVNLFGL